MTNDDPVERYLDELFAQLRGSAREIRHVLAESEAHIRDAVADGASPDEAVARFGPAQVVAGAVNAHARLPIADLVRQLIVAAALLCSVGMIAIGVSGAIASAMDAAYGPTFVAGDLPSITYTAERCAEYGVLAPGEPSCATAAARHHTDEVEITRLAAGLVGIAGLGVWFVLRRRWPPNGAIPTPLLPAVGAAVFGLAALTLAAEAMQAIGWQSDAGMGQWLSAGAVSAIVAAAFGGVLIRELRAPQPVV